MRPRTARGALERELRRVVVRRVLPGDGLVGGVDRGGRPIVEVGIGECDGSVSPVNLANNGGYGVEVNDNMALTLRGTIGG